MLKTTNDDCKSKGSSFDCCEYVLVLQCKQECIRSAKLYIDIDIGNEVFRIWTTLQNG